MTVAAAPKIQLAGFLAKYTPAIARQTRAMLTAMRKHLPGATEMVYDNYNALVIGFGPTDRAGDALFSIVAYPRWVTLFFLTGASLRDPDRVLKGAGSVVRHLVLTSPADLDRPAVRKLMDEVIRRAAPAIDPNAKRRLIIKSISARQRPRRPPNSK